MSGQAGVLAEGGHDWWPPSVHDFYLPSIVSGAGSWFTKFTLLVWVAVALVIVFFLVAYRDPKLVPSRMQWLAESIYGFARNGIAGEVIGPEGLRFGPYLASLFSFILANHFHPISLSCLRLSRLVYQLSKTV